MAGLLDLFSGRSSDIYGNGLLTPEQRGGLGNIGLLALAGKLGQLAGPSFSPVPDFGAAIGQAAGAYGASQEAAGTAALNAILTGQKGQKLQQELDYYKQLGPVLGKLGGQWPGADGGTAATPETGSTGGGAAAPLSAGGDVGSLSDPRGMVPHIQAEATRLGIDTPTALKVAGSEGLAKFFGDGGKSGGAFQLYTGGGMGNDFQRDTGLDPLDPKNEKATITYALERAAKEGWGAWNGAKKLGITGFAGIGKPGAAPTAAAPDGVRVPYYYGAPAAAAPALNVGERATPLSPGGGLPSFTTGRAGLLGGTADAGDTSAPADVLPNRVGRFAGVAPGTPVNSRGFPYNPEITDPAVAARVAQSMAAIKQAQQSGVPWAATRETSGSSTDPIMSVTSADQAGGGDAPGGLASGLLTRGGPLTRGVPGMPAMPPAAAPSADPSLQLGPLAAPAPAAAAPAAPGPGLLSPPGAAPPGAPPIPRGANPAYDAWLRNAGVASALAKMSGLPGLDSLISALKDSPGYAAELERARQRVGVEFAGPAEEAKQAAIAKYAAAVAGEQKRGTFPYDFALARSKIENLHPGGTLFDPVSGQSIYTAPTLNETTDPATGRKSFTYVSPQGNQPTGLTSALSPQELKQQEAAGTNIANFGDLVQPSGKNPLLQANPALATPRPSPQGTVIPSIEHDVLPKTVEEAKQQAPDFTKTSTQWSAALAPAAIAEQRLGVIADAFKMIETGTWLSDKANFAAKLKALGLPTTFNNIAEVQTALHANSVNTLNTLKSATPKFTQSEFQQITKNTANPDLSPGANLELLSADMATIRQTRQIVQDFYQSGYRNPQAFESAWRQANPLQKTVDAVKQEIGPFKGMPGSGLDFSKMGLQDLTAAVTRGDLTLDQRRAIDKRFRELGH
jgi:hypothetical protein